MLVDNLARKPHCITVAAPTTACNLHIVCLRMPGVDANLQHLPCQPRALVRLRQCLMFKSPLQQPHYSLPLLRLCSALPHKML